MPLLTYVPLLIGKPDAAAHVEPLTVYLNRLPEASPAHSVAASDMNVDTKLCVPRPSDVGATDSLRLYARSGD